MRPSLSLCPRLIPATTTARNIRNGNHTGETPLYASYVGVFNEGIAKGVRGMANVEARFKRSIIIDYSLTLAPCDACMAPPLLVILVLRTDNVGD